MTAHEVNFDGLIGPTHNYGGLSAGNLASQSHGGDASNPRDAALQGLEKMRRLLRLGLKQGVLPPQPRPNLRLLRELGVECRSKAVAIESAARHMPRALRVAYSASSMWSANAATASPSADTRDGRVHLSIANLSSMLHRSLEHPMTEAVLGAIFNDDELFAVHPALPAHPVYGDEGAANHSRLCADHGAVGVEFFVHGRGGDESTYGFPARQTLDASEAIARRHGLETARTVHARQARRAIDGGAFHNDVVCVASLGTLFFHEAAFEDSDAVLAALRRAGDGLFELKPVMVAESDVPLADAIKSYLFNSQLLNVPEEDRLVLIAPREVEEIAATRAYCEALVASNGPIGRVDFVDVRQSMANGGGPACLRLRVVLTEAELEAIHPEVLLTESKIDALSDVVSDRYRDRLTPADLADPSFADEAIEAYEAIMAALDLPSFAHLAT